MIPILVIFDCDGVLVDTETVTDGVLANYVSTHGAQITRAQVHDLFTGGTMEGAGQEAAKRGAILPDTWLNEIYVAIFKELGEGVDVFPGLIDLLDALDTQGIPYAVASNGPMAKMRISLGPSGLWDGFIHVKIMPRNQPPTCCLLHVPPQGSNHAMRS